MVTFGLETKNVPAVSVLLPVHNAEAFIENAIASILSQTFHDFEILVYDDGSTDASGRLISRQANNDNRIRVFSAENRGLLRVLQLGVDEARGEFIARMDADDIAFPDRFEKQLSFLHANPECVAVGSRVLRVDPDGDPLGMAPASTMHDSIVDELMTNGAGKICHPTVMMRTEAVREVGGYQQEYHLEDVDLFLRLAEAGKLANLDEPLLKYRLHSSSICHTRKQSQIDQIYAQVVQRAMRRRGESTCEQSAVKRKPELNEPEEWSASRQGLENACYWSSLALAGGYRRTAWKHALRAVRIQATAAKSWWAVSCCLGGRSMTDRVFSLLSTVKRYASGRSIKSLKQDLPDGQQGPSN